MVSHASHSDVGAERITELCVELIKENGTLRQKLTKENRPVHSCCGENQGVPIMWEGHPFRNQEIGRNQMVELKIYFLPQLNTNLKDAQAEQDLYASKHCYPLFYNTTAAHGSQSPASSAWEKARRVLSPVPRSPDAPRRPSCCPEDGGMLQQGRRHSLRLPHVPAMAPRRAPS